MNPTDVSIKNVESSDIIRVILQYLKESNLRRTLQCLQEESSVALNAVDNLDAFESDIMRGRWDTVLQVVGTVKVPDEVLYLLYEQVVAELLESQEFTVVLLLLKETAALQSLKVTYPIRYKRLDQLANSGRSNIDAKELYEGTSKEKRRAALAKALLPHLQQAPPSRLLALIGMALKWQQEQGLLPLGEKLDLFRGVATGDDSTADQPVEVIVRTIKFSSLSLAQCLVFTPDGRFLITGSSDGLIEVWDYMTGKIAFELKYQQKDCFMVHESAVLALSLSSDSTFLASGCKNGHIKIWKLSTGQCVKKFEKGHEQGISCLTFNIDNTQLLSGSFDHLIRLHGLKSGRTLREFRGHTSYINAAIFNSDGTRLVSGSSDGSVRIWDSKTTDCLMTFSPPPPVHINESSLLSIKTIALSPKASENPVDSFFVCTQSNTVYLMNLSGQVLKKYSSGKPTGGDFLCACVSPHGQWVYAVGEDHVLYTFDGRTSTLEQVRKIHDKDVIGLSHHPSLSLVASYSFDGNVHLIQP